MANELAYYIRLSEADEETGRIKDESESISNQRTLILKYIKEHPEFDGWTVHEFADDGFSGTNGDRPNFQRMLDRIHAGSIQCVIVKDLSRFARNYIIVGEYLEQIFPMLGVRFIAINDGYDSKTTNSAADSMNVVLKSVLNAYYSKELSHKIRATINLKMQKQEYHGIPPFGYVYNEEKTHFVVDPDAAKIVRLMFDLALQGNSGLQIANFLNNHQIPTIGEYNQLQNKQPKTNIPLHEAPRWDSTKVVLLLRNPVYKGTLLLHKTTVIIPASKKIRKTKANEQYVYDDAHEAIVTPEEFDRVQELFPRQIRNPQRNTADFPLKNVVYCGSCKRTMLRYRVAKGTDRARYYCRSSSLENTPCTAKKHSEKDLEQIVLQALLPMLKLIHETVGSKRSRQDQTQSMLSECQHEIRQALSQERKIKLEKLEIYEAYTVGNISIQTYKQKKNALSRQGKQLAEKLSALREQENALKNGILPANIAQLCDSAKEYRDATILNKDMVNCFVERVNVYEDHYEIVWKFQDIWESIIKKHTEINNRKEGEQINGSIEQQ
ncbi:MAG: recombinase family protein [Lachnospiraceae bacterium]|nr:recombinase family protein [Lachnospiraceae bacterium]